MLELHVNTIKKREFTTYIVMHILNQFTTCEEPTHAFSLWILLQFVDFKLIQKEMVYLYSLNK